MPGSELSHIWCWWAESVMFSQGTVSPQVDLRILLLLRRMRGVEWALVAEPHEDEANWASHLKPYKSFASRSFHLLICRMGILID